MGWKELGWKRRREEEKSGREQKKSDERTEISRPADWPGQAGRAVLIGGSGSPHLQQPISGRQWRDESGCDWLGGVTGVIPQSWIFPHLDLLLMHVPVPLDRWQTLGQDVHVPTDCLVSSWYALLAACTHRLLPPFLQIAPLISDNDYRQRGSPRPLLDLCPPV